MCLGHCEYWVCQENRGLCGLVGDSGSVRVWTFEVLPSAGGLSLSLYRMSQLRSESNNARDEAREHAARGTDAAKESAKEFKGAVQSEGVAVMKGAEDRYESAKDYTKQKSGEIADSAKAARDSAVDSAAKTKDSAVDSTVRAKDSVAVSFFLNLFFGNLCDWWVSFT